MSTRGSEDFFQKLRSHYESVWGKLCYEMRWSQGPVSQLPEGFHTEVFQKDKTTKVIVTSGLSLGNAEHPIELCMYFPSGFSNEARLGEILTITAHYHLTGGNLGVGDSVNWGEPIIPGSQCAWGYLSWPYLEGKVLGDINFNKAKVFWLVPLTEAELAFKKAEGVEALEVVFEGQGLNYIDFLRGSLC
jgi:hypothetical protein